MIIGIDFDNTIIDYEHLFSKYAQKNGWLENTNLTKSEVKSELISKYGDDTNWQRLQAEVYGKQIKDATLYSGCYQFIQSVVDSGNIVYIVSHKTEFSNFDGKTKLIEPAIKWLFDQKLIGPQGLLAKQQVSFHSTRSEKIQKICELHCDLFIDDLSEVLLDKMFPKRSFPILFSSNKKGFLVSVNKWEELQQFYRLTSQYELAWLLKLSQLEQSLVINLSLSSKGGNNLIYVAYFQTGTKFIVKLASTNKLYCLKNEFNALTLFNQFKIKNVPKVISFSSKRAELIQSYLPGKHIQQVENYHIDKVIKFIFSLERLEQHKIQFINIGNYRNKLSDYVDAIESRWDSINRDIVLLLDQYPIYNKVVILLQKISPIIKMLLEEFEYNVEHNHLNMINKFSEKEMIFNPSDFGFHNILESQSGELQFLDFEYFVYDDKAKMVCDFIHHAGHKLTIKQKIFFLKQLNKHDFFVPALKQRIMLLINMVGIEWLLIILNIAQKDKLEQKIHANPNIAVEQIVETQYDKAKKRLFFFQKNIRDKKELFTLGIDYRDLHFD